MPCLIHTNQIPKLSSQHPLHSIRLQWGPKKKTFEKIQLFHFFQTLDPDGAKKIFQYLGHYLPPESTTFTTIKFLKLCKFAVQCTTFFDPKNLFLTFNQQKTSNIVCHSNQSPVLKFSPTNCLYFLFIHPSAEFNNFLAFKLFLQPPISPWQPYWYFGCKNQQSHEFVLLTLHA